MQGSVAEKWDVLKGALHGEANGVMRTGSSQTGLWRVRQLLGQALMRGTGCMLYGSAPGD